MSAGPMTLRARVAALVALRDAATPGPWAADTREAGDCVVWAGKNEDGSDRFLCNIGEAFGPIQVAFDAEVENTLLIAAAPDAVTLCADLLARVEELERAEEARRIPWKDERKEGSDG